MKQPGHHVLFVSPGLLSSIVMPLGDVEQAEQPQGLLLLEFSRYIVMVCCQNNTKVFEDGGVPSPAEVIRGLVKLLPRNTHSIFKVLCIILWPLEAVSCAKMPISMCVEFLSVDVRLRDEHHVRGGDHKLALAIGSKSLGVICREWSCESQ